MIYWFWFFLVLGWDEVESEDFGDKECVLVFFIDFSRVVGIEVFVRFDKGK